MNINRECSVQGHLGCYPSRICIYEKCNINSRWCCSECVLDKTHLHGQSNYYHIHRQQEFIQYIHHQYQQYNNNLQPKLNNIVLSIQIMIQQLKELETKILQSNVVNFDSFISQATNDFLTLDDLQIEQLINLNKFGIYLNLEDSDDLLKIIQSQFLDLQNQNKTIQIKQNLIKPSINEQNKLQVIRFSKCPNNHNLQSSKQTKTTRTPNCDSCQRKRLHLLGEFWFCKACDYDICLYCSYDKQKN